MRMGSVGLLDTQQAGAESSDLVHKTSVNTAQARVELQAGVEPSDLVHKTSVNTAQARVEPQAGVESSDLVHKTSVNTAQARVELQAGVEPSDLVHTQQAGVEPHKANADDEETTGVGSGSNIGLPNAGQQKSAADVVNTYDEEDIANIIYRLGDERRSRAIAKAIVARREEKPFSRTLELAELVQKVLGRGPPGKHPATRTFQALRLYVNDELGQLVKGLAGAERVLKPGGRLVVVTFHSLEDRIVKRYFASRSGKTQGVSRHMPQPPEPEHPPSFQIINSRSLTSSKAELEANPRARSARLRFGVRTDAEAWPVDAGDLGLPLLKV
ncbi:MAG: 16S rRNA (cytosine(1402)-N(4))-methyltransferase RsmH [Alphaproteobacteria bacterium]|nr:16S rRNA (cytosine(1402)-N(4))-methyltransferase RsmH [Alphaproteobacteria bacterium]